MSHPAKLAALRVQGHYLAIATLGFALFVQQVLYEWESLTGGRHGINVLRPNIFGFELTSDLAYCYLLLPIVILFGWVTGNLRRSHTGLALFALKMSAPAATSAGIDRARHLVVAFTVSAFFTGISGALYAHLIGYLSTEAFFYLNNVLYSPTKYVSIPSIRNTQPHRQFQYR